MAGKGEIVAALDKAMDFFFFSLSLFRGESTATEQNQDRQLRRIGYRAAQVTVTWIEVTKRKKKKKKIRSWKGVSEWWFLIFIRWQKFE